MKKTIVLIILISITIAAKCDVIFVPNQYRSVIHLNLSIAMKKQKRLKILLFSGEELDLSDPNF